MYTIINLAIIEMNCPHINYTSLQITVVRISYIFGSFCVDPFFLDCIQDVLCILLTIVLILGGRTPKLEYVEMETLFFIHES
jgi:hypothetical protein